MQRMHILPVSNAKRCCSNETHEWECRAHGKSRWVISRAVAAISPSASYGRRSRVLLSVYVSSTPAWTVYLLCTNKKKMIVQPSKS